MASYLTAYIFHGKYGIAHIALSDQEFYYSYSANAASIENKIVPPESSSYMSNSLDTLLLKDFEIYGNYHTIILPAHAQLKETLKNAQKELKKWNIENYNLFHHNCAHAIQSYFVHTGYLQEIIALFFPLTPREVGNKLTEVGKTMVYRILEQAKTLQRNADDISAFHTFIQNVKNSMRNLSCPDFPKLSGDITSDYYLLLKYFADKHYSRDKPLFIFEKMFADALEICPIKPIMTFTENRILKSIPRIIASALIAAIVIPVYAALCTVALAVATASAAISLALAIVCSPFIIYLFAKEKWKVANKPMLIDYPRKRRYREGVVVEDMPKQYQKTLLAERDEVYKPKSP